MPMIAGYAGPDCAAIRRSWHASLTLGFGGSPIFLANEDCLLAQQGEAHSPGTSTVLHGWIDNLDELSRLLGAEGLGPAQVYELAVTRWGRDADDRIIGNYAAISRLSCGALRLARSPWSAPPLYHARMDGSSIMAASSPNLLFAAGMPRAIDYDFVTAMLALDYPKGEVRTWFKDIFRVPLGTVINLTTKRIETHRWYDPAAIPGSSIKREEDWVEAAQALLDQASAKALASAAKPGLLLSGGLDSPIVAASVLRQMPAERRLETFTFVPDAEWDGIAPSGKFGDEAPLVDAFVAGHPRLNTVIAGRDEGGFDHRLRDLIRAGGSIPANVANIGVFHAPWRLAREAGCDWLFNAGMGNLTFSNKGDWAFVEYLLQGRLPSLAGALASHANDQRALMRRFLSLSLLPLVPDGPKRLIHSISHAERRDWLGLASLLQRDLRKGRSPHVFPGYARTRVEWLKAAYASADSGEDSDFAFEQLYGVRQRDITAYRPLIEFCAGLPTRAFIGKGMDRRLARLMARGIMPETQRLNQKTGRHNVDWQVRMGRRRAELLERVERLRLHPYFAEALDLDRMKGLLEDWPRSSDWHPAVELPRSFGLTRAFSIAQFVTEMEGRNDV